MTESLVPFDALAGAHGLEDGVRFAGFVAERAQAAYADEMTDEAMDTAAESIAAESIHSFTWETGQ